MNLTNAFFTGRIPADYKFLIPKIRKLISISLVSTYLYSLRSYGFGGWKGVSNELLISNLTSISPHYGSLGANFIGCHWGIFIFWSFSSYYYDLIFLSLGSSAIKIEQFVASIIALPKN